VKWLDHGIKVPPPPPRPPAPKPDEKPDAADARRASEGDGAGADHAGEAETTSGRQGEVRNNRAGAKPPQMVEREIRLSEPVWTDDGSKAVLLGRAADNKDRWIFALDTATGKARVIATDHDDAWVDGPGSQTLGWMPDGQHVYFQSERDGYAHLYAADYGTGEVKQLTSGKWEVTGVQLSNDKSRFLLTTSEASPGDRQIYWMPAAGGQRTALTTKPGNHQPLLSPDEKWLAVIYSYSNKPPELFVQENRPDAVSRQLTTSPSPEFAKYNWIDPPIVSFSARDGAKV